MGEQAYEMGQRNGGMYVMRFHGVTAGRHGTWGY